MADPGPVAASLWLDDALESPLELDGVITLVDAVRP
jgi:G3E family GTPase